jgi:hypothetical protein
MNPQWRTHQAHARLSPHDSRHALASTPYPGAPVRRLGLLLLVVSFAANGSPPAAGPAAVESIFESGAGLGPRWHDLGWAPRELLPGQPAKLDLYDRAGWILARPRLSGSFDALLVRYRAPAAYGDFLELRLDAGNAGNFPRIAVTSDRTRDVGDGWREVVVPMTELNPRALPFEQVILRARLAIGHERVLVQRIALLRGAGGGTWPAATPAAPAGRSARFVVDCRTPPRPISPYIYALAGGDDSGYHWEMGAAAARWGGNPSTRYNWQLGNAWNAGADWFFRNVDYTGGQAAGASYELALRDNLKHGVMMALTVPIIGWVAKDTTSYSFPVSVFGPQQAVAPELPDAGNGKAKDGTLLPPGPPTRTSVAAPPELIARWIATIREKDRLRGRSVRWVILDNEPMLWHVNHRDVHPKPLGYDELLERSIAYATAIRKADPQVLIAGPAEWGWTNYFYSAKDMAAGQAAAPDRRAHGNVPLLPWWLFQMRAHERKTGLKLLDMLDVHYYPAGQGIGVGTGGATDRATNARRIRSTRSLWDPTYVDESWIGDTVELIPRLRRWVAANAPGIGISIGEYNFGAETHQSAGLAQAEALGRFGTEGLTAAFYWRLPPKDSPVYWAFRAYRNFDGKGGRFLDLSAPVVAEGRNNSMFASRSAAGDHLVAVLLNLDPEEPVAAEIDLSSCGGAFQERALGYSGGPGGLAPVSTSTASGAQLRRTVPPYSITVLEWKAATPGPAPIPPAPQAP